MASRQTQLAGFPVRLAIVAMVATSCAVGPKYRAPPAPTMDGYTRETLPSNTLSTQVSGGESQHFLIGHGLDADGRWWVRFDAPQLDSLEQEALTRYPDIAAQKAALQAAWEDARAAAGVFFPQVQGEVTFQREEVSGASLGPGFPGFTTGLYQSSVNVSYVLDVFGGGRRVLEGAMARAQEESYRLQASRLTLTANVAATVIQLASVSDQIEATQEIIRTEEQLLEFIKRRLDAGSQTRADVLQQESNVDLIRATLPTLRQSQAATEHKLALLTGQFPRDPIVSGHFTLTALKLPQQLPVSLPSSLVTQRPDIQAQEAKLHEASASVGVATANLLPQLTISASGGNEALEYNQLWRSGSGIWSLTAGLTQPLFEGGSLRAKRRAAIDRYDQTLALYQLTVLTAFQNVADALTALLHDAEAVQAQSAAYDAAKSSFDLVRTQYEVGATSYVDLLTAQRTYEQARLAEIHVIATRYLDTVTLFQALGGGWIRDETGKDP